MTDGLKDRHRDRIIKILASNDRVERAILFGSRAMETFSTESDVDIALCGERLTTTDRGRMATELEETTIPQRADLVLYSQIGNEALREHIRRHGIEWYRRPKKTPSGWLHLQPGQRKSLETLLREHLADVEVWACGGGAQMKQGGKGVVLVLRGPGLQEVSAKRVEEFLKTVGELTSTIPLEVVDWSRLTKWDKRKFERQHLALHSPCREYSRTSNGMSVVGLKSPKAASDWRICSWGELGTLEYGRPLRNCAESNGSYRVYGSNGPIGWCQEAHCNYPSVIIGRKGALEVHYSAEPFSAIDTAFFLKPKTELDTRWAYYAMLQLNLKEMDSGSAIPSTSRSMFYNLPVLCPPLSEQRAIARILGALDDRIELNRRMCETLEAIAQAIFKDWFVDFGPTRAKAKGRAPYLHPEMWELFPNVMDNEGNPIGWKSTTLDGVGSFLNGIALQKHPATNKEIGLPVIKVAELRNGISDKTNRACRAIPEEYKIQDGDFLFSWSASLLAKFWTNGEGALNQHLFKVTSDKYPTWFLSQWIYHHMDKFRTIAASKATTMGHIKRVHLKEAHVVLPPVGTLSRIDAVIAPIVRRSIETHLETRTIVQVRDQLLPKLLSGELRIFDVECIGR